VTKGSTVEPTQAANLLATTQAAGIQPSAVVAATRVPTRKPTNTPIPATSTPPPSPTLSGPQAGDTRINPVDGATLVYVPAGRFTMGLTPSQGQFLLNLCSQLLSECETRLYLEYSSPAHTVQMDGFWIGQTEVSNAMYAQCVRDGSCSLPRRSRSGTRDLYYDSPNYANYPVIYVNWYAADTYCNWAGGSLPTEAQWEYAARGSGGWIFPWGDTAPDADQANIHRLQEDLTSVDAYPAGASPFGALNMTGNVWEWVADWWLPDAYTKASSLVNPTGPSSSQDYKVGKGGSFWWSSGAGSPGIHDYYAPDQDGSAVGFRCAFSERP
jgi:formylglycine-generating enzyme required for sulfatase activity